MKKKICLLIIAVLSVFMILPKVEAKKNDKITIYMFRGKGCGYCRSFLTFLSNINEEYGKYFELESYEVWYDADNNALMKTISGFLGEEARGVPYIIIGDKVFAGYSSSDDNELKSAIKKLYDTKKSKRYDVFKEYKKENKLTGDYTSKNLKETLNDESIELKGEAKTTSISFDNIPDVLFNLLFVAAGTGVVIFYTSRKFKNLEEKINNKKNK